ncbi:MAG: hypothetical protein R6X18_03465 [Chloroflexota bacterium]|jgi:hypothetical protein
MVTSETFSVEEWAQILSAPASVGALVVTADPSGPVGLIKEFRSIMDSMKAYVEQNAASSPLMAVIKEYISNTPSEEEEAQLKEWAQTQQDEMAAHKPQTPEELHDRLQSSVSESLEMLRSRRVSEADILSFKTMMYYVAEATAEASKEGGFLGFGGVRISDKETSVLAQIKSELGLGV